MALIGGDLFLGDLKYTNSELLTFPARVASYKTMGAKLEIQARALGCSRLQAAVVTYTDMRNRMKPISKHFKRRHVRKDVHFHQR